MVLLKIVEIQKMQDESHLTERSLLEAFERMRTGREKTESGPVRAEETGRKERDEAGRPASRGRPVQQAARRRRFVGDGAVVVEHQSLGRPGQKRTLNRLASTTEAGQEVERLKQGLERERRRAHDAETELGGLKERVRAADTQMTHLRLQVEEGRKTLRKQEEDILYLRAELHQLREEKRKRPAPVGRPRKKAVVTSSADADEFGQEPVKWWKD